MLGGLSGNVFHSTVVDLGLNSQPAPTESSPVNEETKANGQQPGTPKQSTASPAANVAASQTQQQQYKIKIKAELMAEGLRLGSKSSLRVYEIN